MKDDLTRDEAYFTLEMLKGSGVVKKMKSLSRISREYYWLSLH